MAQHTAEEVQNWTKMEEARNRAAGRFGENSALESLWERIRSGLIPTASLRWTHQLGDRGAPHPETNPRILTTEDWAAYRGALPRNLWRGEAHFIYPSKNYSPDRHLHCFEIVCDPAALDVEFPRPKMADPQPVPLPPLFIAVDHEYDEKLAAALREGEPSPTPAKHPGGRPPYDWDSIWAAVGARLAAGWKPRQQKDIEAEMKVQAGNLKMKPEPKRTALQERARKLAKALGLRD